MFETSDPTSQHTISRRRLLRSAASAAIGVPTSWLLGCRPGPSDVRRWGSSTLGSSGYVIMEAFARAVNRGGQSRNASLATSGAAENLWLLANGSLELGHTTSVDWTVAARGQSPYPFPILCQQVFAYATWHMPPIVRTDANIDSLVHLRERRYAPSTPGSGAALMHHGLMQAAELYDDVRWTYGSWTEIYDAFQARRVDVVPGVLTNGAVSARLIEAQSVTEIVPLSFPDAVIDRANTVNPGIYWETVTKEQWSALETPVVVPYSVGVLAAAPGTSAETGYEITKAVFEDAEHIRSLGLALRRVEPRFALERLMPQFPVNGGALQYFSEQGIENDALSLIAD